MILIDQFPLGDSPHIIIESKVQTGIPKGYLSNGRGSNNLAVVPMKSNDKNIKVDL